MHREKKYWCTALHYFNVNLHKFHSVLYRNKERTPERRSEERTRHRCWEEIHRQLHFRRDKNPLGECNSSSQRNSRNREQPTAAVHGGQAFWSVPRLRYMDRDETVLVVRLNTYTSAGRVSVYVRTYIRHDVTHYTTWISILKTQPWSPPHQWRLNWPCLLNG